MNCYDCHPDGLQTTAVAICYDCGAGVCPEHAIEGTHYLTVNRVINRQVTVEPPQRRIRCHICATALTAASERSVGVGTL